MKRLLAATLRVSRGGAGVSHLDGSLLSVPFPLLSQRNMYRRCEQYRMHEKHRRCVRCNSGGGDGGGGAPRPVRRPADLDTDIERVRERERGRDWEEGGREGGEKREAKLTRARIHVRNTGAIHGRDARDDEDIVSRPSSSRCPSPPPIFRNAGNERERESPT